MPPDCALQEVEASPYAAITDFELWNEPDNTWLTSNGTFNSFWTTTFDQVRSLDPGAVIQGPSFSDNISGMQGFLENAVATNTVDFFNNERPHEALDDLTPMAAEELHYAARYRLEPTG